MHPVPTRQPQETTSRTISRDDFTSSSQHGLLIQSSVGPSGAHDTTVVPGDQLHQHASESALHIQNDPASPFSVSAEYQQCDDASSHDTGLNSLDPASPDISFSPFETWSASSSRQGSDSSRRTSEGPYFTVITSTQPSDRSMLLEFPEEILLHILSHLPASDMLTVKLLCRRFRDLVNSPHAWIDAFCRFFPGPQSVQTAADVFDADDDAVVRRSTRPQFARLRANPSWAGEYLARTQLLRCLYRGKPAMPFAAPTPNRPGKGNAIFTFSARLGAGGRGISHLHANFGHPLDKRLPQFVHGIALSGAVTSSDKRGKFDSWGVSSQSPFLQFTASHPGTQFYGVGSGDVVGVPNVMDLSQTYGMMYGEGTPGGHVFFLSIDERRGRYLAPFNTATFNLRAQQLPRILHSSQSTCCVWIAKSSAIPSCTNGLVGMLSGSSCGAVSAYSFGVNAMRDQRLNRGDLSARWLLSPGVPIIAVAADDSYTVQRLEKGRVWAVALNALGEVFYLTDVPHMKLPSSYEEHTLEETRAWSIGGTVQWRLVKQSCRIKHPDPYRQDEVQQGEYYGPINPRDGAVSGPAQMEQWLRKNPAQIRADYAGWDMRRMLEIDFSGDDGKDSGESIVVISCGDNEEQPAFITRYRRSKLSVVIEKSAPQPATAIVASTFTEPPAWSFPPDPQREKPIVFHAITRSSDVTSSPEGEEWHISNFSLGKYRNVTITTTGIDTSKYAVTTSDEDEEIHHASKTSSKISEGAGPPDNYSPFHIPGQRARLLGVGTASGIVLLWNVRAAGPVSSSAIATVKPVRIIHTDSPSITSLAISALYVVVGGSEGLVQAWDPLGSTMNPVRILTSRSTLNARRRQIIAQQQTATEFDPSSYAAGAISLDPDPTVLRGVVAIGGFLRYWSFSSSAEASDLSKSQKRRMRRSDRGLVLPATLDGRGIRRVGLKGLIAEEVRQQQLQDREDHATAANDRRVAARFGTDLLGEGASDEQLLAYARMLSEEEYHKQVASAARSTSASVTSEVDSSSHVANSASDLEFSDRWKYASWDERRAMSASSVAATPTPSASASHNTPDDDLARALELSLSEAQSPSLRSSDCSFDDEDGADVDADAATLTDVYARTRNTEDDDIARAIRESLGSDPSQAASASTANALQDQDEDTLLAQALSLSLAEAGARPGDSSSARSVSLPTSLRPTTSPSASSPFSRARQPSWANVVAAGDEEFPALSSPAAHGKSPGHGKGKGRAP